MSDLGCGGCFAGLRRALFDPGPTSEKAVAAAVAADPKWVGNKPRMITSRVRNVTCGTGVTLIEPSNLYDCTLADDVFVGPFCEVQRHVKIGKRTRVQSHSFICSHVTIGDDCFIGHGVMFINDLFKNGGPSYEGPWLETVLGNHVSMGSNVTVLPVRICDDVVIGAGCVVTHDITEPGTYAGNPARRLRSFEKKPPPNPVTPVEEVPRPLNPPRVASPEKEKAESAGQVN